MHLHSASCTLSLSLSVISLCMRTMHILPNAAPANSTQKVMEIIFPMSRGHVGMTAEAAEFPPQQWLGTDPANLWGWGLCAADDVPCTDRLTWLVMPTMRPAPVGLSEAEMCVGHSKECTNLLFIKCGVTWDWRLNGDLSTIQLLHRRSHMALLPVSVQHMGLAKCVKDCE